jgi:hypothetical protein
MTKIKKGDDITAVFLNRHDEAADWVLRNKLRGEGGSLKSAPADFAKVMAANYTGQQIYIGDVCEFDGNPFPDIDPAEQYPDPRNDRWVKAVTPNAERIGWGIALDPIISATGDDREAGWFLTVGVCHAIVKIVDNDHKYAEREAGEQVLRSAAKGPVKILHKPAGGSLPERRLCLVQLMGEGGDSVEIVEVYHQSTTDGRIVEANASGYHPGRIRTPNGTDTYSVGADVWIQFAEGFDGHPNDDGAIVAVQGEYYGPAKKAAGTFDLVTGETHDERPVYVPICDERSFVAVSGSPIAKGDVGTVALLHSTTFTSAGINKSGRALQDIPPSVLVKITRRAGVWMIELLDKTLVHFELIDELKLTGTGSGHAKAKILSWNGSAWAGGEGAVEIEVYDWFPGMWNGLAGYRGWAEYRPTQYTDPGEDEEDEEDDVLRTAYEIIWMERPAQLIGFTSTARMNSGSMAVTVDWFDWQGRDPGSSITVYDSDGRFPDVHAGAKGTALYDNKSKKYEVLTSDRVVMRGSATLTANCCGTSATISGFTGETCGEYVGTPPTLPTTATNPSNHAGVSGSIVELERTSNDMPNPTWKVVSITQVVIRPITEIRLFETTIQVKRIDAYVEVCTEEEPEWEDVIEGAEECEEEA